MSIFAGHFTLLGGPDLPSGPPVGYPLWASVSYHKTQLATPCGRINILLSQRRKCYLLENISFLTFEHITAVHDTHGCCGTQQSIDMVILVTKHLLKDLLNYHVFSNQDTLFSITWLFPDIQSYHSLH